VTARKLLLAGRCLRKLMRGPEGGEKGVVVGKHWMKKCLMVDFEAGKRST
jgi:hypothetical protein